MTSTGTRPLAPSPAAAGPAVRTGRAFAGIQLRLAAWLWAVVVAVWVVLTVVLDRAGGVDGSTWDSVDQGPRWFLFAMAVIMVTGYLPAHVANGMTRRSFTAALGVVMLVTAAGYALLWTLGLAVERAVWQAQGWPTAARSGHLSGPDGPLLLLGLEAVLLFAVYAAGGMLVGATYLRGGAWWGTLTLPLTVGPVLLAEVLASGGRLGDLLPGGWSAGPSAPAAGFAALVLIAAALATAAHLLIRDVPIRTSTG